MRCRKQQSFTLVELLAVMMIIAILAGMVVAVGSYATTKSRINKSIAKIETMELALEEYSNDRGYYPSATTAVQITGVAPFDDFKHKQTGRTYLDGYKEGTSFLDGWGKAIWYKCPGTNNPETFDLWSVGPNQTNDNGGNDDIGNWQRH